MITSSEFSFIEENRQITKPINTVLDHLKYIYHKIAIKTEHSNKWASVWLPYWIT